MSFESGIGLGLGLGMNLAYLMDTFPVLNSVSVRSLPAWSYVPLAMVAIYPLDRYLRNEFEYTENHRWCYIHSLSNAVITCLTARGAVTLFSSDATIVAATGFNLSASVIVMALHLYHLMMFKIKKGDILMHHIVMLLVLLIPFWHEGNEHFLMFTDYSLFFLCGLPGGIDYYLMHLCYTGKIDRLTEKRINTLLNAYIRAPGILYGAFYIHRNYVNQHDVPFAYMTAVLLSFMWNAQHFFKDVAVSYGKALEKSDHSNAILSNPAITGSTGSAGSAGSTWTSNANCAMPSAIAPASASSNATK